MAAAVQNAGLATIKIDAGAGLEILGYTRNGADITEEAYMTDVPGDENGGDEGPPIEIQIMGETARVRLELTKWDAAVAAKITSRVRSGTAGTRPTPGVMLFSGTLYFRLLVHGVALPQNFLAAIPRAPIEINKGTKFATLVVEFECHAVSGVIYNATTT